jgi:Initiator Replication protein
MTFGKAVAIDDQPKGAVGASRTLRQHSNSRGFPKPGELIELANHHELEAADRTIFNILYQHAHDSGRLADPMAEWEIPMTDLRSSKHESNDRVRDSLRRLRRVEVIVPYFDANTGEPRTIVTGLFDFTDLPDHNGGARATVRFGLPKKLCPILEHSRRWGRIMAEVVLAMTSKYAIALYELIELRAHMTKCVEKFSIARFRDLMGVPPGALLRGSDFVRKVLDPAELEVNGLADIGCKIVLTRKGNRSRGAITHVTVGWWPKNGDKFRASMEERRRTKLGRMARLAGKVDQVAKTQGQAPEQPPVWSR